MNYWRDKKAEDRVIRFFSTLSHVKGEMAGQRFVLEPWQEAVTRKLFGEKCDYDAPPESAFDSTRDEYRYGDLPIGKLRSRYATLSGELRERYSFLHFFYHVAGVRRYRTAYVECGRKQGKTTWQAGTGLYMTGVDEEEGAEVYSVASDIQQASICYEVASAMVERHAELDRKLVVQPGYKLIKYPKRNGRYRVLSALPKGKHGYNPSAVLFDELHEQPNRELWDTMDTGKGARRQALTFAITTAGYDRSSICWELHEKAKRILNGEDADPTFLPVIFGADEEDDWTSPETWKKACPNLGISVPVSFLEAECRKAIDTPGYENTFRRLYLSQWTQQDVRWLSMLKWDRCIGVVDEGELVGAPSWAGLDLALTRDLSAFAAVWPLGERESSDAEGNTITVPDRYAVRCRFWAPQDSISPRAENDAREIRNFASKGLVTLTEGNVQDHRRILREVAGLCEEWCVQAVAYDPAKGGSVVAQELQDDHGIVVERFTQSPASYTPPMELLESIVSQGRLEHFGDVVLRWCAGNVSVERNERRETMYPCKPHSAAKIDGIVATLMGLAGACSAEGVQVVETSPMRML